MSPNGRNKQKVDRKSSRESIHSGHFMVSDIDDSEVQDGDQSPTLIVHESDYDEETSPVPAPGYDFESACKETSKTYTFGPRSSLFISIDASLTKLFECMTLAYSGKLTSPRWKQFKGLKLKLKEKIRLNNMIWRAWHMQFVMKIRTFATPIQFATPFDGDMHTKPEAVVIEGTYWKRKVTNIKAEYQKWRLFYKDRKMKPSSDAENMVVDFDSRWSQRSVDSFSGSIDEDFIMDFSDTLFSTFNPSQPFDFPNPREIAARAGIADFIQPGLVQLQPAVDDFMDTLEPLHDFLNSKLPTLPEETPFNHSQFSNFSSVVRPENNIYDSSQNIMFGMPNSNFTNSNKRLNDTKRKMLSQMKPQPIQLASSDKLIMENFLNISSDGNQLMDMNPSLSKQNDNGMMQTNMPTCYMPQTELLNEPSQSKMYSRSTRRSGVLHPNTLSLGGKPQSNQLFQPNPSIQVPLSSLPEQLNENSAQVKNTNMPIMLNIDLTSDPNVKTVINNFSGLEASFPTQNIFSLQLPVLQSLKTETVERSIQHKPMPKSKSSVEAQNFRRHSYGTHQSHTSIEPTSIRRSRRIAPQPVPPPPPPPPPTVVNFAIPEIPSRSRIRSRSVSSPQGGSPKPFAQQSSQAISLTDISLTLASHLAARRERNLFPDTIDQESNISAVLPQNAVLAQLLTSGRDLNSQRNKDVTHIIPISKPSTVTLIESLPTMATNAQAFVISPVPATSANVSGVSEFQRSLLLGAANQVFGIQTNPCTVPSPLPNSSGDSSSAIPGSSLDANAMKGVKPKSGERSQYKEHRRVCHINAEQKRRCNIKIGFEALHNLLPPQSQNPNAKVSKAALLQRGAEYIRQLKVERQKQQDEAERLKYEINALNEAISHYQNQLPASGVPVPCQKTNRMKEMFEEYVRQQTLKNWKFWIFSLILEPLVESYNSSVSTASVDEMCKTILSWLDQHCSLVALRPGVLNSLRHLSTTTNILADPSCMPEEATRAVTKEEPRTK